MASLAIIGTGIAGLGCAHFLHRHFNLTLFEQNDYAGGHTNTVIAPELGTSRSEVIASGRVLRRINYEHPLFSLGTVRAQAGIPSLNAAGTVPPLRAVSPPAAA